KPSTQPWRDRTFDLRVEDHPDPIPELKRLVRLKRAYARCDAGDEAIARKDIAEAMKCYDEAAKLAPDVTELVFWQAVTLFFNGREAEALPLFKKCFEKDRCWYDLVPRLAKVDLLPNDPTKIKRIQEAK